MAHPHFFAADLDFPPKKTVFITSINGAAFEPGEKFFVVLVIFFSVGVLKSRLYAAKSGRSPGGFHRRAAADERNQQPRKEKIIRVAVKLLIRGNIRQTSSLPSPPQLKTKKKKQKLNPSRCFVCLCVLTQYIVRC